MHISVSSETRELTSNSITSPAVVGCQGQQGPLCWPKDLQKNIFFVNV